MKNKVLLCIFDGFGVSDRLQNNAVLTAKTPNLDGILSANAHCLLQTHGVAVGLPEGQMGNSEVGHSTIGAGRVLPQTIVAVGNLIESADFAKNSAVRKILENRKSNRVHLVGMYSAGGVHAYDKHLHGLIKFFAGAGKEVFLHLFSDGRDVPPNSFEKDILRLANVCKGLNVRLVTIAGRYYGMDRDGRDERTGAAFNAIAFGRGVKDFFVPEGGDDDASLIGLRIGEKKVGAEGADLLSNIFYSFYKRGVTDEFIEPAVVNNFDGLGEFDDLFFFNFRGDRMVQIVEKFVGLKEGSVGTSLGGAGKLDKADVVDKFDKLGRLGKPFKGALVCMVDYFAGRGQELALDIVLGKDNVAGVLGGVLDECGVAQFRVAETEKYAHVTYFFNAGREEPFGLEDRVMVPSPKVATYDLMPQMSAQGVCDEVLRAIHTGKYGFILVNFANGDMVGHSGNFEATVKAVECLDDMLGQFVAPAVKAGFNVILTSDHGNAEELVDANGVAHTQHTLNPVYFIGIGTAFDGRPLADGGLCDVAPTVLDVMGIKQPPVMTGRSLFRR